MGELNRKQPLQPPPSWAPFQGLVLLLFLLGVGDSDTPQSLAYDCRTGSPGSEAFILIIGALRDAHHHPGLC